MKSILSILVLMSLALIPHGTARADGPQIFITWNTDGYVPAGYEGRILPVNGSRVTARVAVLVSGKFVDLSQEQINWYLDGSLIQSGGGADSVKFDISTLTRSSLELKAQLVSMAGGPYSKTIDVPIAQPEAVIEFRSPGGAISGQNIFLTALPFFFSAGNISDLNFSWQVNGETPASLDNPEYLNIKSGSGFGSGSKVQVSLTIQSGNQSASQSKTFAAP